MKMKNKKSIINNIRSKHILNSIFKYIKDKNFQDKLFAYSKKLQTKFDIKLVGFKENYLKKIRFDLEKYLYIEPDLYKIDCLSIEYNKFLKEKKIKKEKIENYIYDIFDNKEIIDEDEEDIDKIKDIEKLINIESPFFKILSKTKNFGKIFTIFISQRTIDKYDLKDEYIECFDKLNNLNIRYESIFFDLKDINKINYLKGINIDFKKIKRLTIEKYSEVKNENQKNIKNFFEILFSLNNIENNLIYLDVKFKHCKINVNTELFENINNFKSLRFLYIENFDFDKEFIIKLNELKLLSIVSCDNIKLSEIFNEKLKAIK